MANANHISVATSLDFQKALYNLPKSIHKKVLDLIKEIESDSISNGSNIEKLKNSNLYSVRIDRAYRAILAKEDNTNTYLFLWADHHDEAYKWAENRVCSINKFTNNIQIYACDQKPLLQQAESEHYLFEDFSDEQLVNIGVPEMQLHLLHSIVDLDEFGKKESMFSKDTYENLAFLTDYTYNDVLAFVNQKKSDTLSTPKTIKEALSTDSGRSEFLTLTDDADLQEILTAPVEKWRVFLHPIQRKAAYRNFNGPVKVTGSAGTGKTVVAMHRAKYLSDMCNDNEKVLFTTFTRNLVDDIKQNLKQICSFDELQKIEVLNIDSLVSRIIKSLNLNFTVSYDSFLPYWLEAIAKANNGLSLKPEFYEEEWSCIGSSMPKMAVEQYLSIPRIGRGTRLDRATRLKVWHVFEEYLAILKKHQIRDIDTAIFECREAVVINKTVLYKSVIIDEGQDYASSSYMLLRAVTGPEHQNDMFIAGDSHQRIYVKHAVLSQCGINVRGRSFILRVNYRTTDENRKTAFHFLSGYEFDDIDGNVENSGEAKSLLHGEKPYIENFTNQNKEISFVQNEINKIIADGDEAYSICIVARTHELLEPFKLLSLPTYEISGDHIDDTNIDGIRLSTMHRVKGLEFKYVFVVSVNDGIMPMMTKVDCNNIIEVEEREKSERCLLYVSVSRAQKRTYILSFNHQSKFIDEN